MTSATSNSTNNSSNNRDNYRLLRIYTYYRTALGSLLMLLFTGNFANDVLGRYAPKWFFLTALVYTVFNLLTLIGLWRRQEEPDTRQLVGYLIIDVAALTLLSGTSGGIASGLSYLLVITVAASAIFLTRQLAIFIAALATVTTLTETLITAQIFGDSSSRMFSAGALGILLFATALLFQYLTQRIRESSEEADIQAQEAAKARDTSQKIIERMRTGVLVTDSQQQIQLINNAACRLLGLPPIYAQLSTNLSEIPLLADAYQSWQENPKRARPPVRVAENSAEVRINFAELTGPEGDTLIFVEDHRLLAQEAQKLKLGSLGKLTASIAHEVRNPLGAIAHAAQLLTESPELADDSKKLLNIILNHSKRVNQIIENTLQLSRRSQSQAQVVELCEWLPKFISEYSQALANASEVDIELNIEASSEPILAKVDINHLRQILTNLFDNGLRYGYQITGRYHLQLRLGYQASSELASLLIIDDGPGVSEEMEESIFEPFFTTENTGSGLGLYISRELCQSNQASLTFTRWQGKSCFQIKFAHAQQVF
ncbi:sensor histidine kinase [Halioxenophilus sp. WMMB6]|uniref:sensor histidine kinase n=1 Tax=Halioxenophilus sp. WMMB6 TaxID=3073815 RepID=UPI00295EF306|nr:ATP-binding protein [Halioxenophilus sp. WMMB6]